MKIINQTKNTVLAQEAMKADTIFKRIKGLLGRKDLKKGQALILQPCDSVHTFFMQFPIDVLFINKYYRVIKAIPKLKPFRISGLYLGSFLAVELPAGTIVSSQTQIGDTILFAE